MKEALLILALGALATGAASPAASDNPAKAKAACGYVIQRANAAAGHAAPRKDEPEPGLIRAVDKRLDDCPVLVKTDGRMIAPPAYTDGPARHLPAQ
ncbi:hypothetical protein [Novosphingobium sp. TCA1]|uniref:hypothetical protein n=1 Tax=Novosphingobium sp. TCA1 TaxID=2682474 RepID=UPI0013063587|nr:hypothetical protein [Novosphingobium sp. TCA1]GFE76559.1 hypothetical protein NTCA1_42080 [Novosphingobium sp. TCA1]